jgi:hypothetical protein
VRRQFWRWVKEDLALSEEETHEALGVESVYDFPGTMVEAKERILAWIAGHIAGEKGKRSVKQDIEDLFGAEGGR